MRQSVVQTYCSWMFYLPLAFIVPPRLFYVHLQINLLYQFWIHTKVVGQLGILEYILNTPSHHRVHHGRNPRYLDRNYGGVLIIFDRMFGTFQVEDEEVFYGLVHPAQSFSLWSGQFAHFFYMASRIWEERGFWNKWAVIWKGPGWRAGAPRFGFASDIPEIDPSQGKYDPKLPTGHYWYLGLNFVSIVSFAIFVNLGLLQTRSHTVLTPKTQIMMDNMKAPGEVTSFEEEIYLQPDGGILLLPSYVWHAVLISLFTLSLQSFALISDNWRWAPHFEAARCFFFLGLDLLCYLTAAPGEHRIFWYTDPAKRFTAWSLGFVLLRLNLLISGLYMVHHIFVRDAPWNMPRRTTLRKHREEIPIGQEETVEDVASLEEKKKEDSALLSSPISLTDKANKSDDNSATKPTTGSSSPLAPYSLDDDAESILVTAQKRLQKYGDKTSPLTAAVANAADNLAAVGAPESPLINRLAGKQSASPISSPETKPRSKAARTFPVGVAM